MKELVSIRVSGKAAQMVAKPFEHSQIAEDIFEIRGDLHDPLIRSVFINNGKCYFISWHEIRRQYDHSELNALEYLHVAPLRTFAEPMPNPLHFDFLTNCRCNVPSIQTKPLVLSSKLRCKDDLVNLSEGSWICSPSLARTFVETCPDQLEFTPVFNSEPHLKRFKLNLERKQITSRFRISDHLSQFCVQPESFEKFEWMQLHIQTSQLEITLPTDGRQIPFTQNEKEVDCRCDMVYDAGQSSELNLKMSKYPDLDIVLTQNFIGFSIGVFLPQRKLLVSNRLFHVLSKFRLHNLQFEAVHFVK